MEIVVQGHKKIKGANNMSNFLQQNKDAYNFYKNKELQKKFNDELVQKTGYYQKKFGFETNPRKDMNFGMWKQTHLNTHLEVLKCI